MCLSEKAIVSRHHVHLFPNGFPINVLQQLSQCIWNLLTVVERKCFRTGFQLISNPWTNESDLHTSFLTSAPVVYFWQIANRMTVIMLWWPLSISTLRHNSPVYPACTDGAFWVTVILCFRPIPECNVLCVSHLIFIFVWTAKCGYWLLDALNCETGGEKKQRHLFSTWQFSRSESFVCVHLLLRCHVHHL